MGYFDKIQRADTFVFLDAVDYPRSGSGGMGSWSNRVKIAVQGEPAWFGCPVDKKTSDGAIMDVCIAADPRWKKKALKTIQMNYAKSPNFDRAMSLVTDLIQQDTRSIADFNIHAVETIAHVLGLETPFVRQSALDTKNASTSLLIEICDAVDCDTYLAGGGAGGYQEDDLFEQAGIRLEYQGFTPHPYGDENQFQPGLSVIDYLFHAEGIEFDRFKGNRS
jgi:hypothetical protein